MQIKHNHRNYLFLISQKGIPINKDLKIAFEQLPQKLFAEEQLVNVCPSTKCYFGEFPELTFYQTRVPLNPDFHSCTPTERKACIPEEKKIPFQKLWNPYRPQQEEALLEDPNRWIAYLIDLKSHDISAIAEGTLTHSDTLEVHPNYCKQGLCPVFTWLILRKLREWKMIQFTINNAARNFGEKCYRRAGHLAGLKFHCQQYTTDRIRIVQKFNLR